jgi:diketogulonate reductase-like aldo/keto reductase
MAMTTLPWITTTAGVNMPCLVYGTAWKKAETADLVEKALLAGFRGIDTAGQPKHYDEALVGVALQRAAQQGIARDALYCKPNLPHSPGKTARACRMIPPHRWKHRLPSRLQTHSRTCKPIMSMG